jgi:hypothetical protein
MAKIVYSALVTDIRGRIGGNVFARNANGAYVRQFSAPINTNTTAQQLQRATFGGISRGWRELTPGQRESFITQAPNFPYVDAQGQPQQYTGYQLYQKVNSQLQSLGAPGVFTMPPPVDVPAIAAVTVNESIAGDLEATWVFSDGSALVPVGFVLAIDATRTLSQGVYRPKRQDFKQLAVVAAPTAEAGLLGQYQRVYGSVVVGNSFFVRIYLVSLATGQTNNPVEVQVIATA